MPTILAAMGAENVNGIAKAPDVFTLEEQTSSATTTQAIVELLNNIYGAGTYARATTDGATTGGGRVGLIYNQTTVQLIAQTAASTASGSGGPRATQRYQLRPTGYDSSADFYLYASHYKASQDSTSAGRRNAEAVQVRANADTLGDAHIIYAGDFNVYTSSEAMYQTLLSAGNGQAFDPLNRPGNWHDGAEFKDIHTQSPALNSRYDGQVGGGVDDRFDFQLLSGEFLDGEGLSYIANSYRAFGNTNTHLLNNDITTGSAVALQNRLKGYTTDQASAVLAALASASDHLPTVVDYQVPAKLGVQVGAIPSRLIRDAAASLQVTVSNMANVVAVVGADELDYQLKGSGSISGSIIGLDEALGTGNIHLLTLGTSSVGIQSGTVEAHSTSQGAANKDFVRDVSYAVIDHSRPLFVGAAESTTLHLDLGVNEAGSGNSDRSFTLGNWISPLGSNAGLDLDSFVPSGDSSAFSLTLAAFQNLSAGATLSFSASLLPSSAGFYSAFYDLLFSDEDLPGATATRTLRLELVAQVIPEPSTSALLIGSTLCFLRRRRS